MKIPRNKRLVGTLLVGGITLAAVGLAHGGVLANNGSRRAPVDRLRTMAPPSAQQLADLRQKAWLFAARNGDPRPSAGQVVATTRQQIASLDRGVRVDSDQEVYVVQLRGTFTAFLAHVPKGVPAPRGTLLTIVYDASSGYITDWSLQNTGQPLSILGPVQGLG